jgi:hypothetical protein
MSLKHKQGIDAAYELLSVREPDRQDVEDAIRAYHEKAYKRQDNSSGGVAKATRKRYVGPWEPTNETTD